MPRHAPAVIYTPIHPELYRAAGRLWPGRGLNKPGGIVDAAARWVGRRTWRRDSAVRKMRARWHTNMHGTESRQKMMFWSCFTHFLLPEGNLLPSKKYPSHPPAAFNLTAASTRAPHAPLQPRVNRCESVCVCVCERRVGLSTLHRTWQAIWKSEQLTHTHTHTHTLTHLLTIVKRKRASCEQVNANVMMLVCSC